MRTQTAINHLSRLTGTLQGIYSSARYGASTHEDILALVKTKVWDDPALDKCPGWIRGLLIERGLRALESLHRPQVSGQDLERMLEQARKGESVDALPYLRWALFLDGREVSSDEISRSGAWSKVEGTFVWNHRADCCFSPKLRTSKV